MPPTIISRSTLFYEGGLGQYAERLTADLGQLYNTEAFSDVTIHCSDGNVFKVNCLLLVNASKLFKDIFKIDCNCSSFATLKYDVIFPGSEKILKKLHLLLKCLNYLVNKSEYGLNCLKVYY